MSPLTKLIPDEWTENVFSMLDDQWMLIAAEKDHKTNAMTASWGGFGVLWEERVATIYVRNSRYTREFLDAADTFSLTVFDEAYKPMLLDVMGSKSGRDIDKIKESGLTLTRLDGTPAFGEARLAIVCEKLYRTPFEPKGFAKGVPEMYADGDFHIIYIGRIKAVYSR